MLQRLLDFGKDHDLFKIKPINEIDKSCCEVSVTEVIDFDETKRKMIENLNQSPLRFSEPKSCDALKILVSKERIDFIEFKGLNRFLDSIKQQEKDVVDEKIQKQVVKFDFESKIKESLWMLDLILHIATFKLTKEEKNYFRGISKNYLIMVDVEIEKDPIKNMAFNLAFLSTTSNYTEKIVSFIEDTITGFQERIEINKPIIISSNKIDSYYKELESVNS